jgi:hypothetical protein
VLKNGKVLYLTEFSVPPGPVEAVGDAGLLEPTEYGNQVAMIETIQSWLPSAAVNDS